MEKISDKTPIPQSQSGKKLVLIRHAKSSWGDASLDDFDRPLNPRGFRDAPDMGQRLAEKHQVPDHFAASPAARAWATAEIIAQAWNFPVTSLQVVKEAYEASSSTLIELVRHFPAEAHSAALTAHNPGITRTINLLAGIRIFNVPTCGVAVLQFPVDRWTSIEVGTAELIEYDFPKNRPTEDP
ncbi:MAG: histidine phosphatase family protein [Opitutae bacterium]|nr:histidine phosphatase family protein [Opitutae bacterium]|tara:strand:- start:6663 stop:7214 length:552 start_codon:yes stop_codon:yes gene_type:complete